MRRLAIIPNDPIDLYLSSGYGANWLKAYFNPARFFDEVYSLAPYERVDGALVGVIAMPTAPEELPRRLRELKIDVVRAYGGSHSCDIACGNKISGVPVVVSVHDTSPGLLHSSIADADVVLCMSDAVRRLVSTKFRRTIGSGFCRIASISTSCGRARAKRPLTSTQSTRSNTRILHVGRRSRQKNLANLIRALGILGGEYCLVASGKGPLDEYVSLASERGCSEPVFLSRRDSE